MKKTLISMAMASVMSMAPGAVMADQYEEVSTSNDPDYTAIGFGAVGGALLAGPAGLIIGGVIGSFVDNEDDELQVTENIDEPHQEPVEITGTPADIDELMIASTNDVVAIVNEEPVERTSRIKEIIVNDLAVSVYFKPGSTDFESFYTKQFAIISGLLHEMPEMELNLEGYSDRQGTQEDNLKLSEDRIESVRDYFVNSGIDASRIIVNAYGEKNFQSVPGELDSYMFDRRVVVSFKTPPKNSHNSVATVSNASSM